MKNKVKANEYNVIIRCPIHGNIFVEDFIVPIIDTKEFQRLRRISQMGCISQFYPSATHNRFVHSLGTYEIARKIVVDNVENDFTEYEKKLFMLAALLHDIGHGPLSHSFETIFSIRNNDKWKIQINHEEFTKKIILDPNTEVNKELKKMNPKLPQDIVDVLSKKYINPALSVLISSQVDVDRMDYLLRDSYYTGTNYGNFDLLWILRAMVIKNKQVLYHKKALTGLENYLFSRYFAYEQIYFNPKSLGFEIHLSNIFLRLKELVNENSNLKYVNNLYKKILDNPALLTIEEYINLDDYQLTNFVLNLEHSDDAILKNLVLQMRKHYMPMVILYDEKKYQKIINELKRLNLDPKYYLAVKEQKYDVYKYYDDPNYNIQILYEDGSIKEFSYGSQLFINKNTKQQKNTYIYVLVKPGLINVF